MFARTSTWSGSPEELQKWADHAASKVKGFVEGLPGNAGVMFLIDRDSGTALTLTLWFIQGGQLGQFGVWGVSEFAFLLRDLRALAVTLAGDRDVFTQRHRHRPGDQSRQPGGEDGATGRGRPRYRDDNARYRHDPVIGSQFSRPAIPPACGSRGCVASPRPAAT